MSLKTKSYSKYYSEIFFIVKIVYNNKVLKKQRGG